LLKVSASGGVPAPLSKDFEPALTGHPFPQFLPDGRHFLYISKAPPKGIYVASLDSPKPIHILDADSRALYVDPGYLLAVHDGILLGYPFDPRNLNVTGEPVGIVDHVGAIWLPATPAFRLRGMELWRSA
jgi:hypothetical protein